MPKVYPYAMPKSEEKEKSEHKRFTAALASFLSVSPEQIQEKIAQAKDEEPSPHTRYKYVPEERQP
jgi:hypothetical protein